MKFDCIIVLANEMDKEGNLNAESLARINLGCEFYFKHPSTPLITCGWNYRQDSPLFIGEVLKNYAVNVGVPAENILEELTSRDTVGDAFFTKQNIVKDHSWEKLLVITSDYHVNRTAMIFRFIYGDAYTIEVIGASGFKSPEKQASENRSIEAFERTFKDCQKGNDKEIYERLASRHPFYNGEIYSKIIFEIR